MAEFIPSRTDSKQYATRDLIRLLGLAKARIMINILLKKLPLRGAKRRSNLFFKIASLISFARNDMLLAVVIILMLAIEASCMDFNIDKAVSLDFYFFDGKKVVSELSIDNLNIKGAFISGKAILKGKLLKDKGKNIIGLTGKLYSNSMSLNAGILPEFRMFFKLTKEELEIYSLDFGKAYNLKGRIGLKEPFETELYFDILRANIRDIALIAKAKNPDVVLGIMNGFFSIKGKLCNLESEGSIQGRYGKIGPLGYDIADIRFEGLGPIITIADSRIKQGQSTFTLEGYIDLRKIVNSNIFEGIKVKSDMKTIVWDGWDISKDGPDGLKIVKGISDNVSVGFKTVAREPLPTYQDKDNPEEMSLEYKMNAGHSFQMKLKENEEFFGIERKTKF